MDSADKVALNKYE